MSTSSRFCGNKAGMDSVDKSRISRIIEENTSRQFGDHEQKRNNRIEERVLQKRQMLAKITDEQIGQAMKELEPIVREMETRRTLNRFKLHIDMDAFYAAVECRDNPTLRTIPMAVGSDSMLSTSNYIARKFGVRSAMPGFIGKRLCPQIVIVPGNFAKYKKESQIIRTIFERFDPNISMGSLDEAYLDLTDHLTKRTSPVVCKRERYTGECVCRLPLLPTNEDGHSGGVVGADEERITEKCNKCGKERVIVRDTIEFGIDVNSTVQQIRFEVEQATGLTCSGGIAANGMLAKICSDLNKPNGQFYLENTQEKIVEFMKSLPVRKVPGIGPVSEAVLKALGFETCGDLFANRATIRLLFHKSYSEWLLRISLGISGGDLEQESGTDEDNPKSTSIERTFSPTRDMAELLQMVRKLCDKLINSLAPSGIIGGRAATLKIKFATFDVITRCKSVDFPIRTAEILYPIMEGILRKEMKENENAIRLLGVRLSNLIFTEDSEQEQNATERGIQQSLHGFVKPIKCTPNATGPPIVVELDSDPENAGSEEEEEDILNSSAEQKNEIPDVACSSMEVVEEAEVESGEEGGNSPAGGSIQKESSDDEADIVFLDEIANHQKKVPADQKRRKRKRESSGKKKQSAKQRLTTNMKDLRNYFPTII